MPSTITQKVNEKSTAIFTVSLTDEDGKSVVPKSLAWSLVGSEGGVVNSRERVAIEPPTSANDIVLSGDDLAMVNPALREEKRWLVVEGTYASDAGEGLPFTDEVQFTIYNLRYVQ